MCCLQWLKKTNLTKIGVWWKSLTTQYFLEVWKSKKVIGCYAALEPSIRRFGRSKRHRFEPNSLCLYEQWVVVSCSFFEFLEDFRQTNCGVPLRMDRPTMLKCNSRYMTSFAEETEDLCFEVLFSTNNIRWICLVLEGPHGGLLFCFGLIHIRPWFVTCDDLINVQYFYAPIDKSLFEWLRDSASTKVFYGQVFMHVLNVCWWEKCPRVAQSHYLTHSISGMF